MFDIVEDVVECLWAEEPHNIRRPLCQILKRIAGDIKTVPLFSPLSLPLPLNNSTLIFSLIQLGNKKVFKSVWIEDNNFTLKRRDSWNLYWSFKLKQQVQIFQNQIHKCLCWRFYYKSGNCFRIYKHIEIRWLSRLCHERSWFPYFYNKLYIITKFHHFKQTTHNSKVQIFRCIRSVLGTGSYQNSHENSLLQTASKNVLYQHLI